MTAKPLISVVMPVYNGMPFLSDALDSVLAQHHRDFELIVVDDGSNDDTPEVLAAYAARDSRIHVLKRGHEGIVGALNAGLEACRGDLIARMDADDVCDPDRFGSQYRFLERHPEIGLIGSLAAYQGNAETHRGLAHFVAWNNQLTTPKELYLYRFVETPLIHPTVMFRCVCVERFGGYRDGDFPEDYELWLRWLEAGVRMAKIPEPLVFWREREDRLTRVHPRYAVSAFYRCKSPFLARWLAAKRAGRSLVVWGAGRVSRGRARHLVASGARIHAFVDIDPRKIGQVLDGCPVWAKDALPPPGEVFVLSYVGNRGARELIAHDLGERGYCLGRDWLPVA